MKKLDSNKSEKIATNNATDNIKPDREVLREPGQISFKDALKKAILPGNKKKK